MHQLSTKRNGFTLIELMLAMTFVSILLIAIALLTIYISNLYTRGITLRQVNEAGISISSDLSRTIQTASQIDLATGEGSLVLMKDAGEQAAGRLCIRQYSYIWNYGKFINKYSSNPASLPNHFVTSGPAIRFIKVVDKNRSLCQPIDPLAPLLAYPAIPNDPTVTTELLASGDRDLALHAFEIQGSKEKKLYSIALTIGTNDTAALDGLGACKPPVIAASDENYCAVNKFDIVARTGN